MTYAPPTTVHLGLPLPSPDAPSQRTDVERIAMALEGLDGHAATVAGRLSALENAPPDHPLVRTPTIISPTDGATSVARSPTITTSAYASLYGVTQAATQVQIATDAGFTLLVQDAALGAATNWTSQQLAEATEHWARARHQDADGVWSGWSAPVRFVTIETVIATPTLISPANGAAGIGEMPILATSAFAITGGAEAHAATDWQIASDAGFTAIIAESLNDTANKTSWTAPAGTLATSTTYHARARHHGSGGEASAWSAGAAFTTDATFFQAAKKALVLHDTGGAAVSFRWVFIDGDALVALGTHGSNAFAAKFSASGQVLAQRRYNCGPPLDACFLNGHLYFVANFGVVAELNPSSLEITAQRRWTNVVDKDFRWGISISGHGSRVYVATHTNQGAVSGDGNTGGWTIAAYGSPGLSSIGVGPRLLFPSPGTQNNFFPQISADAGGVAFLVYGGWITAGVGRWLCVRLDASLAIQVTNVFGPQYEPNAYRWSSVFGDSAVKYAIGNGEIYKFDVSTMAVTHRYKCTEFAVSDLSQTGTDWLVTGGGVIARTPSLSSTVTGQVKLTGMSFNHIMAGSGQRVLLAGSDSVSFPAAAGVVIDGLGLDFAAGLVPELPNVSVATNATATFSSMTPPPMHTPSFTWRTDLVTDADVMAVGVVSATPTTFLLTLGDLV